MTCRRTNVRPHVGANGRRGLSPEQDRGVVCRDSLRACGWAVGLCGGGDVWGRWPEASRSWPKGDGSRRRAAGRRCSSRVRGPQAAGSRSVLVEHPPHPGTARRRSRSAASSSAARTCCSVSSGKSATTSDGPMPREVLEHVVHGDPRADEARLVSAHARPHLDQVRRARAVQDLRLRASDSARHPTFIQHLAGRAPHPTSPTVITTGQITTSEYMPTSAGRLRKDS